MRARLRRPAPSADVNAATTGPIRVDLLGRRVSVDSEAVSSAWLVERVLDAAGDGFLLSVTEDGPGVPDAELAQVTTRWFRGSEARTRRPDGKGLGLAIVAESVKRRDLTLTFHRPGTSGLRAEIRG